LKILFKNSVETIREKKKKNIILSSQFVF